MTSIFKLTNINLTSNNIHFLTINSNSHSSIILNTDFIISTNINRINRYSNINTGSLFNNIILFSSSINCPCISIINTNNYLIMTSIFKLTNINLTINNIYFLTINSNSHSSIILNSNIIILTSKDRTNRHSHINTGLILNNIISNTGCINSPFISITNHYFNSITTNSSWNIRNQSMSTIPGQYCIITINSNHYSSIIRYNNLITYTSINTIIITRTNNTYFRFMTSNIKYLTVTSISIIFISHYISSNLIIITCNQCRINNSISIITISKYRSARTYKFTINTNRQSRITVCDYSEC